MKKTTMVSIALIAMLAIPTGVAGVYFSGSSTTTPEVSNPTPAPEVPTLNRQQKAWLGALEWCESKGKATAINPKDSDGTPSYGLLEFKPSTYSLFAKQYGLASTTDYMNPDGQEAIVTQMILRGVNLRHQFPACTTKLGLPPMGTSTPR